MFHRPQDSGAELTEELDLQAATETVEQSLIEIWKSFLGHVPQLMVGFVVLLATAFVAWAIRGVVQRILKRTGLRRSLQELFARLFYIALWILGLGLVAMVVFPGLTPTRALGGVGLASVAVSFAFKDIFENFFAGILILWRFPFDSGDFIECDGILGKVEEITIRNTLIRRTSGELVIVPNSKLFNEPVEVLTNDSKRRVTLMSGVAYDEDVEAAVEVITKAVEGCESVATDRPLQVFPKAFGASSVDIEVAWWTGAKPVDVRSSRAEVVPAIKQALDDAGIEIPFPYRTLTFKEPLTVLRDEEAAATAKD